MDTVSDENLRCPHSITTTRLSQRDTVDKPSRQELNIQRTIEEVEKYEMIRVIVSGDGDQNKRTFLVSRQHIEFR